MRRNNTSMRFQHPSRREGGDWGVYTVKQSSDSQPSSCSCGITAVYLEFAFTGKTSQPCALFTHRDVRDARLNFCRPFAELHKSVGRKKVFDSPAAEKVTMSRKKAVKGKVSSRSPKGSPSSGRTGKGLAAAAAPSSGLVYPSRPSLSNSGEFYDIAFKVSGDIQSLSQSVKQRSHVGNSCVEVKTPETKQFWNKNREFYLVFPLYFVTKMVLS